VADIGQPGALQQVTVRTVALLKQHGVDLLGLAGRGGKGRRGAFTAWLRSLIEGVAITGLIRLLG
jgi:hypothetical protein